MTDIMGHAGGFIPDPPDRSRLARIRRHHTATGQEIVIFPTTPPTLTPSRTMMSGGNSHRRGGMGRI